MKELFKIDSSYLSDGSVLFFIGSQQGTFWPSAGSNGIVHFDRHGAQVDEMSLPSKQPIIKLDWDMENVWLYFSAVTVLSRCGM